MQNDGDRTKQKNLYYPVFISEMFLKLSQCESFCTCHIQNFLLSQTARSDTPQQKVERCESFCDLLVITTTIKIHVTIQITHNEYTSIYSQLQIFHYFSSSWNCWMNLCNANSDIRKLTAIACNMPQTLLLNYVHWQWINTGKANTWQTVCTGDRCEQIACKMTRHGNKLSQTFNRGTKWQCRIISHNMHHNLLHNTGIIASSLQWTPFTVLH